MTLEELKVVISAQTEPLKKGIEEVKKQMGGLQQETSKATTGVMTSFKKLVSGVIALKIGQKIGQAISTGIREAINVEAAINQIKRIMGESSNQFLKWANTQAIAFNMSTGEALKYGSVFGNLLMTFAKSSGETMKYTEDLLKASSVIASATGRSMQDVMERIRSGLLGNTEAIEDLGVNVNVAMIQSTEAFKKFANGKSWQQLTFQEQQQIRLMAILEQTNKKYGDSINKNTASQLQQLVAQLKNVQLSLGQAFLPIVQIILPALTALASRLSYVMGIVAQFSQALFGKSGGDSGKQAQYTNAQAAAMTNLGNATEKAGKQAKGALAGFDEINSLGGNSDDSTSGGDIGAGAGGAIPMENTAIDFETNAPEISKQIQDMASKVRSTIGGVMKFIEDNKAVIISIAGGIGTAFAAIKLAGLIPQFGALASAIGAVMTPVLLVGAVIAALAASFIYLYQTNDQFRSNINEAWAEIGTTLTDFWNNTLIPLGDYLKNEFFAPIVSAIRDNILPVLSELFVGAAQILNDLLKLFTSTFDNIWRVILQPVMELIKKIIIDALEIIKKLWDEHGKTLINNVRNFIQGLQETFQLIWDNVLDPIIKPFLEMLTWLWEKHLKGLVEQVGAFVMKCVNGALELYNGFIKPIIDWIVVTFGPIIAAAISLVTDVFGTQIAAISDFIKSLLKMLGGIIDFIVGVFTGNWKKAWQGVSDIFGGIFDGLVGLVKVPLNLIIDAINFVIRALNSISIDVPDWVPGIGGDTWGINIPQIPKLARGGIVDSPTVAMIGEAGKEAVVPLENTSFVDKLASSLGNAVLAAMQFASGGGNNQGGEVIIQLDGTILARVLNPYANRENSRIGTAMITEV